MAVKPGYVKVLLRRGLVNKKLKKFDEAFDDIAEAYVLAVKSQQTVAGIQDIIASTIHESGKKPPRSNVKGHLSMAYFLCQS